MAETRGFRTGLIAFALAIAGSLVAVAITWLTSSPRDFVETYASWNCRVSREISLWPLHWYCLPGALRFSGLWLWASCFCFGAAWWNKQLAENWLNEQALAALVLRLVLAALAVGMLIFVQMYFAAYVLDSGGPLLIAGAFIAALLIGIAMFPRGKPLLLALPLTLAGFFAFALHASILGIVFDV